MSALIENEFCNLGMVTRITRIIMAKILIISAVYSAIMFGPLITGVWLVLPILVGSYLLLTALIGWDPLVEFDKRLKSAHFNVGYVVPKKIELTLLK